MIRDKRRWFAGVAVVVLVALVLGTAGWMGDDGGRGAPGAATGVPGGQADPESPQPAEPADEVPGAPEEEVPPDPDEVGAAGGPEPDRVADPFPGPVSGPVPVDGEGDFGDGVTVRLLDLQAVTAEGNLPGERSGPAVAVVVEIANGTGSPIVVGDVVVDLVDDRGISAPPVLDPERPPLRGEIGSGERSSGTYVFSLDAHRRREISVGVRYAAGAPTVVFTGAAPPA